MLIERVLVSGLLILLHPHVECAGCRLLGQHQKLRNININTDIVRIAAALGPCGVIGHELQVYFVKVEGVIPDLYETSLRILADDLPPVVLWRRLVVIFHANHPLQAVGCYLRPQSRSLQNPHQISSPELPCTI